jgi:tetratricopeptide (TPR) repeat protein
VARPPPKDYKRQTPKPETIATLRDHVTDQFSVAGIVDAALGNAAKLLPVNPQAAARQAREILKLSSGHLEATLLLARALRMQGKPDEAATVLEPVAASPEANERVFLELGSALVESGEATGALACFETLTEKFPDDPRGWMARGHALAILGRREDSIAAYREAIARQPSLGEAYWSIANLKTARFTAEDAEAMRAQLARPELSPEDRLHFDFALGKALEDLAQYPQSFVHYARANTMRRKLLPYSAARTHDYVERLKSVFTADFFAARADAGTPAADPIFIVGLPRSGSTLVEQILASHSSIEGTAELPIIPRMTKALSVSHKDAPPERYPETVAALSPAQLRQLGERYLALAKIHRKLGRPFFLDKMPNNFFHTGFIHLILPKAKIIDVRRHPLACGVSCFTHHFAFGQPFLYDLADIGYYYADYAELMAHFDAVLPGRVHRLFCERLIADPESEIHRLLDYCGLPFEEACLRFHDTERPVRTASAQQVRQPMFRDGLEHWRVYERWLGPLKAALGSALDDYPQLETQA